MTCEQCHQELPDYLYRLLPEERQRSVESHLRQCPHCAREFEPLRRRTCRELIHFLADYISDELAPDERANFEAHLKVCPACVNYLRSYQITIQLGKAAFADPDELPCDIPDELVRAIVAARPR
jgi:anti-sigma factor RsiW